MTYHFSRVVNLTFYAAVLYKTNELKNHVFVLLCMI